VFQPPLLTRLAATVNCTDAWQLLLYVSSTSSFGFTSPYPAHQCANFRQNGASRLVRDSNALLMIIGLMQRKNDETGREKNRFFIPVVAHEITAYRVACFPRISVTASAYLSNKRHQQQLSLTSNRSLSVYKLRHGSFHSLACAIQPALHPPTPHSGAFSPPLG